MKKRDWIYFALVAVAFAVWYYFVCEDSPMHDFIFSRDHIDRRDTPWFFTCGKALMNGMVPYVEFADSKGPLLWVIYGIAYLISPCDYFGMFIIDGIGYIASLLCMYLTVKLFTKNSTAAAIITLLTVPFLFIPSMHYETKSEDTSFIFMALSLWQTCKILYSDDLTDRDWHRAFFLWGLCFGGTLMIKYNSSAMIGIFLVFMLIKLYREKRRFWPVFWWAVGGAAAIVAPLVIYLLGRGAFLAFVDDYFIQTPQTVANLQAGKSYFMQMVNRHDFMWVIGMILAGCISSIFWLKEWKYFPAAVGAWFIALIMYFARGYYIIICGPLMVFVPLTFYFAVKNHRWTNLLCAAAMVTIFAFVGYTHRNWYTKEYFGGKEMTPRRQKAHAMDDYIASKAHKPLILYYGCSDKAYGMSSEALPACRYWSLQGGYTQQMGDDQQQCVESRVPDFIFVKTDAKVRTERVVKNGYRKVNLAESTKYHLYERIPDEVWRKTRKK